MGSGGTPSVADPRPMSIDHGDLLKKAESELATLERSRSEVNVVCPWIASGALK